MLAGPWVVPIRRDLDDIARLMAGDLYIGRGSRQRGLLASPFSNSYKVGEYGRVNAIHLFEQYLDNSPELIKLVPSLSGKRLVCHCSKSQSCHGDILVKKFVELFPDAYDRNAPDQRPPTSSELNLLATHTGRNNRVTMVPRRTRTSQRRVPAGRVWVLRYKSESVTLPGTTAMVRASLLQGAGQSRAGGIRARLTGRRSWRSLRSSLMHVARRPSL